LHREQASNASSPQEPQKGGGGMAPSKKEYTRNCVRGRNAPHLDEWLAAAKPFLSFFDLFLVSLGFSSPSFFLPFLDAFHRVSLSVSFNCAFIAFGR
jgi:hypothetical protein